MLSYPRRIAYSMGRTGSSLLLTFIDFAGLNVYYAYFLLNPLYAGLASAFGFIVIGLSHWTMGYRSDITKSRFGRRRPFLIIGAPALAITGFLIFVPQWFIPASPNPPLDPVWQLQTFGYYLLLLCLFKFFYAFLMTAYQAWLPEIAEAEERPNIAAMQNTANWIGDGVGIIFGFLPSLLFVAGIGILTSMGFILLITICLLEVLLFLPSILFVRTKFEIDYSRRSIVGETKTVLKNSDYVKWIIVVGFWSFSLITITQIIVPMLESGMGLPLEQLAITAVIFLLGIFIFLFVWAYLVKRIGKRRALTVSLLILTAILPFTVVLGLPMLGSAMIQVTIYGIPLAGSIAALYLMRYIVLADFAHKDRLETGQPRAGMYEGFQGVALNIFQAIGTTFLGWFLLILQVSPGPPPINFGFFWWGPVYAVFFAVAAIILQFTKIDPDFSKSKEPVK